MTIRRAEQILQLAWWSVIAILPFVILKAIINTMKHTAGSDPAVLEQLQELVGGKEVMPLLVLTQFWMLVALSIPCIFVYIGFAIFGHRLTFRREEKPIWHT